MAKNLIIVESPAKTRTLKKFLDPTYAVEASMGHIRDLAKKEMGIGENYEPHYEILTRKKEVVKTLRREAKKADSVYLAPDPDREGEAIAWHIAEVLGKQPEDLHRVTFNEITRQAVLRALENPGSIDSRKVDAQQARRLLDRLMGFRLSPLLWDKVKRGLSAGRVQSVALKMVCERQAAIDAFKPEEYWLVDAHLAAGDPPPFAARLHRIDNKKAKVENGDQARRIVSELESGSFKVHKVEKKASKQRPSPPFITSRLQQEAARRYGFTVKRTMALAQGLYEGKEIGTFGSVGLITYMRTDSTRVAEEAVAAVRGYIGGTYGDRQLPPVANSYQTKKGAQDAHEAIRPTTIDLPPAAVKPHLSPDEHKLYELIWNRFVASQMLPAVFDVTQADIENGIYQVRASGRILKSPGFLAVYREVREEDADEETGDAKDLPPLEEGQELRLVKMESNQKFTQPPARYSEATLVKALEENGIGRPSTYAQILSTLTDRDYAAKTKGRFRPTVLGKLVNDLLQKGFNGILNEKYTAELEDQLDRIEDGELPWKEALAKFDRKFTQDLATAGKEMPNVKREGIPTEERCPECGAQVILRVGRYGGFLGCSNYPECTFTRDPEAEETPDVPEEEVPPCEKCGQPMALKRSRYGTFWGCTGYPQCRNIRKTRTLAPPPKPTGVTCPECGQGMIDEKRSRKDKVFYSCNRYPDCKFALWNRPVDQPCPQCGAPFLIEKTTKKLGTQVLCRDKECGYEEKLEQAYEGADPSA